MDAARTLKANLRLQGSPCGWCRAALQLGEDTAVCTACEAAHHHRCWANRAGCSTAGCANVPLPRLEALAAFGVGAVPGMAEAAPGTMRCPTCHSAISIGDPFCSVCRSINSPDGVYHGPRANAPGAVASLVYGIIGLFVCGIVFGPLALSRANAAKRAMFENPTLGGNGLAMAGTVLGILDIVAFGVLLVVRLGMASAR